MKIYFIHSKLICIYKIIIIIESINKNLIINGLYWNKN